MNLAEPSSRREFLAGMSAFCVAGLWAGCKPDRTAPPFRFLVVNDLHHGGWQFLGFDSTDGNAWRDTRIGGEALAFLESAAVRLDREAPTVVFTHFPLAAGVPMAPLNAADVLAGLDGLNLRAVFGGHFHGSTERPHRDGVLTTGACCSRFRNNHDGTRPEGSLLCTAHPDGTLERAFVEYEPATPAVAPRPIG